MTSDEQRKADLFLLRQLSVELDAGLPWPENPWRQDQALRRQLRHLLACAKFVEEHGDTLRDALIHTIETGEASGLARPTLEALAALRKP